MAGPIRGHNVARPWPLPRPAPASRPDYAVFPGTRSAVAIGVALGREQHDTVDFFLARRQVPWWAACLSFLATEISAVTIISVPATAYAENWEYVQFFVGSSLAKLVVAFLFIPAFYRHEVTTIYEFLAHRFGSATQVAASIFFFVTRRPAPASG
jgi:Na+/proline symporter